MTMRSAARTRETPNGQTPPRRHAERVAVYLYAILPASAAALPQFVEPRLPGLADDGPVVAVEAAGLVAAVSAVPAVEFDEEHLNRLLTDLERLAPLTVRHQAVVDTLHRLADSIIPITFGAVYRDVEGVMRLLDEQAERFHELLRRLCGTEEWGVRVRLDARRLDAAVEAQSPALRLLAKQAVAAGPGRAYLLGKSRERAQSGARATYVAELLDTITERLQAHTRDVSHGAVGPAVDVGTLLAANLAFLVAIDRGDAFLGAIEDMRRAFDGAGLELELTGPWAPYSFVRVRDREGDADARN